MSDRPSRLMAWLQEAKRRRLFMPVVAYTAVAVTIIELSGAIFEALLLPDWGARLVTVLLILGFPVVIVLAWVFDLTPEGVRKTEGTGEAEPGESIGQTGRGTDIPPRLRVRRVHAPGRPLPDTDMARGSSVPESAAATLLEEEAPPSAPPDPERVQRAALGHVRHELKTPINGILGYSEMLLEDLADTEESGSEILSDLGRIRDAGRKLLELVDEILAPGRMEKGRELDLDEYGAQIRADLRNPVNAVVGYAEMLKETSLETGRDHLVPDLERIEKAARRLLDLSSDIVQVATAGPAPEGGESRLGQASTLTQEVLAKPRPRAGAPREDARGSLLVVDDNAMNRELLSRQLARAGYVVQTAGGGREAVELLEGREFDLVLLDVIMPDMNGLEVLRAVKSEPRLAATPVIMLSSLDDVESAIRCVEMGAEDFLSKPFHPTLLQARIGAILEVRRLREREADHRARLRDAEGFTHRLLRSTFPEQVAERVRAGESGIVESYDQAVLLWCDVEGAARTRARDPGQVAGRIQRILEAVDSAARSQELDTLAYAGDGVVLAADVPAPISEPAHRIASAAETLRAALMEDGGFDAPVRMGIDTGEVAGGVLGTERLTYRLWGPPVDLARSLGQSAAPGEIRVSPGAFRLLEGRWTFASLGVREVPGRGQMRTYLLEARA